VILAEIDIQAPNWLQPGELWTVNTTIYEADLECTPALAHRAGEPGSDIVLSNDRDCQFEFLSRSEVLNSSTGAVMLSSFSDAPYTAMLMSYTDYPMSSMLGTYASSLSSPFTLSSPLANCSNNHEFLAIWNRYEGFSDEVIACLNAPTSDKDGNPIPNLPDCFTGIYGGTTPTNYSAVFCQPKYYEQAVEVTVDAATGLVNSALMLEASNSFDTGINSTFFEHLATYGKHAAATAALNVSRDYGPFDDDPFGAPDVREIMRQRMQFQYQPEFNQTRFLNSGLLGGDRGLNVKLTYPKSMMALAILNEQDLDGLLDAEKLSDSLREVYKMYFSFAVSSELTQPSTTKLTAQRKFTTEAYVTDSLWARLLQAAFCLMAVFDAVLTYLLYNRKLNLNSDPGSLASLLQSITTSPALLSDFRGSEFVSFTETAEKLCSNGNRYQLIAMDGGGHRIDKVAHTSKETKPLPHVPTLYENTAVAAAGPKGARPWELSTWTGAGVLTLFLGLIGLFTFLNESGLKHNGVFNQGNPKRL
jgi:hypothetical protein